MVELGTLVVISRCCHNRNAWNCTRPKTVKGGTSCSYRIAAFRCSLDRLKFDKETIGQKSTSCHLKEDFFLYNFTLDLVDV
ncbi:hypothetical protein OPV22_007856 [Ensete ventricosum]|uniref:Uncharacterized protein n=1 Tax=Ensete ventricosum TaxID=4639 RepID=A0AAV8PNG7_ENSVE|nr:hypothetical protein OPV22_007856 [Ensete ventricosum]